MSGNAKLKIRPHPIGLPRGVGGAPRVRQSLTDLQNEYQNGNKKPLEDLMRAWKYIKELDPEKLQSFFNIGGYHGEPFRGPGATNSQYWGGFCNHGNILFPVWHRAYMMALEQALQSAPGAENVMLPYWDETSDDTLANGIPWALTNEYFTLDGKQIANPLRSFVLPFALQDKVDQSEYAKPKGYETVRYPFAGLVGTPADAQASAAKNADLTDYATNIATLDTNVKGWLKPHNLKHPGQPAIGTYDNYVTCLQAPNYTVFSNVTSANQWNDDQNPTNPVIALEAPHADIHTAVGFANNPYSPLLILASGDMGENNTTGFDPMFFFHHCFVDRMFWLWQQAHGATKKLDIMAKYAGTQSTGGLGVPAGESDNEYLTLDSPLYPFTKADGHWMTGNDLPDITKLGYTYGPGSLEPTTPLPPPGIHGGAVSANFPNVSAAPSRGPAVQTQVIHIKGVNRAAIRGSFIIAAYANFNGKKELIGCQSVLSRWNVEGCANCQTHLLEQAFFPVCCDKPIKCCKITSSIEPDCLQVEIRVITHHGVLTLHDPLPPAYQNQFKGAPFQVEIRHAKALPAH